MKKYTKEEVLSLINESLGNEIDEMAQPESALYRPISIYNDEIHIGWKKELTVPGNRQKFKEGVNHVGWLLGDTHPILFNPDKDVVEFAQENQDVLEKLRNSYGKDNVRWVQQKNPKYQPFRGKGETPDFKSFPDAGETSGDEVKYGYQSTGEKMSLSEKINRVIKDVLYDEFEEDTEQGKQFLEVLSRRSIPPIHPRWREFVDESAIKNNNNDSIIFRCLGYNSYQSKEDFLEMVFCRITNECGEEQSSKVSTHAMARQFNRKYRNWSADRPMEKRYEGKTDIYNLDRRGYKELNLDVSMRMDFTLTGRREGNNFVWKIVMKNKFGEKLPTDRSIRGSFKDVTYKISLTPGSFLDEKEIVATKAVEIGDVQFDNQNYIFNSGQKDKNAGTYYGTTPIYDALIDVIDEFKTKVASIKPKEALKLASIEERDIERGSLSENETIDLVKNILKK